MRVRCWAVRDNSLTTSLRSIAFLLPTFSFLGAEQITRARRRLSTINDKPLTEIDGEMGDLSLKEKEEKAENVRSCADLW